MGSGGGLSFVLLVQVRNVFILSCFMNLGGLPK